MKYAENILGTIGNTPLVKMNVLTKDLPCLVLAKYETFNPGNSVKDRMALQMIEDAEADGRLQPGGTIIEGTSGNTGMGLALAGIIKGYKCVFVLADKQSKEKMDILRAVGAEVVVCPTSVEPEDPRSYYSVSKRLSEETPNSWYVNQYDNPSNCKAHFLSTGPEIWEQTDGKITHFVVGVGTGGTISGVGKYLKEIHKRRIPKHLNEKRNEPAFNRTGSYGGQFHFDYPGLKNKVMFAMGGYGGQAILIDMENSRILVVNSLHYNNKKYKYNYKKLLHDPFKKGFN